MTMNIFSEVFILIAIFSTVLFQNLSASVVSTGDFNKDFYVAWSANHVNTSSDGKTRSLILDKHSGSGFISNNNFLFGQFDMQMKLIPGDSAGIVVAYYLSSDNQTNRDEVDFEFLGNVAGKPYTLQTNVYTNGNGDREQRISLWFDPTQNFHTYSIRWNINQIEFMVDWVPIRTYVNHLHKGVPYPNFQPMRLLGSIWNGESWATNGGKDKINWAQAPFVASFRNHKIDACIWKRNPKSCSVGGPKNWWNNDSFRSLTEAQKMLFKWVRNNYLTYDYCQDKQRFNNSLPKECSLPPY